MPQSTPRADYRLGTLYATATVLLLATQEPFSSLAAKRLSYMQFICLTQIALLVSIPLLTAHPTSRRDFFALLRDSTNYWKLLVILGLGIAGLVLYERALSNAHPIIVVAVLNLSPFWATLVAWVIARKRIPVSPAIFYSCLTAAFLGAVAVVWSQTEESNRPSTSDIADNLLHGTWVYAIPIPLLSALNGTLIGKWFGKYDESGAIAANFAVANLFLIPATIFLLFRRGELYSDQFLAIGLMIVGTIIAASVGRVLYQIALTATGYDNGFVTTFFSLVPALTALISVPLSLWIPDLHFRIGPVFFLGLTAICGALLLFSLKTWRLPPADQ
jgi:drug/metabolite transporter (DMT)-like permease